jgi:hypothetical protein
MNIIDSDGIPPGMNPDETGYIGARGHIKFSGKFYAMNDMEVEFTRSVIVITILRKAIVAQDTESYNIYVIDRESGISLGCRMKAELQVGGEWITYES